MLDEIVCADCDDIVLPVVSFDEDCLLDVSKSEIVAIFFALPSAADFEDVSDPLEWAKRLSQTATPPAGNPLTPVKDLIRKLIVIGDKPLPTETVRAISNNRSITIDRPRVINITVDQVSDPNYELMRAAECGNGLPIKFWYLTAGGKLYGGNKGVQGGFGSARPVLKLGQVLDRGNDAIEILSGTISWNNIKSEARVDSPFN